MQLRKFIVEPDNTGVRLDLYLTNARVWPSRSFVQKIIETGGVKINTGLKTKPAKASYRLEPGDEIEVSWEEPKPLELEPEAIPLEVLYEDQDLVVVNKPRGMVVHPAAGNRNGTLVNALLEHCKDLSGIGGVTRPGIVHRLDKDTSGVLVVAKNDFAHLHLASQIKERSMKRVYLVLVHGSPPETGRIEAPIGRHPVERKKMAVVPTGRPAATNFQVLEYLGPYTYLQARLESGRTHQIRVHMSHLGYPVAGDQVYGPKKEAAPITGQALHASTLGFVHPRTGVYMEFTTEIPEVMRNALEWCRKKYKKN